MDEKRSERPHEADSGPFGSNCGRIVIDGDRGPNIASQRLIDRLARLGAELERVKAERDGVLVALGEAHEELDGCMALPKDADGVTVHFGDVLSQFGKPMRVHALTDPSECDAMACLVDDDGNDCWVRLYKRHHYHEPTVEDVLWELLDETDGDCDERELVAKYAPRLRLAEEEG